MSKLQSQLITPRSTLIEKTALELAATMYEAGRNTGMTSKYPNARAYAKANVKMFIPKAVDILITMMGLPHVPQDQKDEIYDALMERTNDKELSNIGMKAFENNTAHIPDDIALTPLDQLLNKTIKEMTYGQVVKGETKN